AAHDGAETEGLVWPDHADVEPERARPGHPSLEPLPHGRARGEPKAPDRPPADGVARLGGQRAVEPDAVGHEPHVGGRRAEVGYQADGVKCRPAGQLALLDQDDVPTPGGGQVVGDAAADDAPTHDDDRRLAPHRPAPLARAGIASGEYFLEDAAVDTPRL